MQDLKQKILSMVRLKGPLLPVQISKEIKSDILFASAMLSDLVSKKQVLITNVKIGGSPLYYLEHQKYKLQDLAKYLNNREKEAFDLLREKKILKDKDLEPVKRVALRQIKDFAIPLNVKINDNTELFWKWYITSENEARTIIENLLEIREPRKIKPIAEEEKKEEKPKKETEEQKKEDFGLLVENYFKNKSISVMNKEIIRKKKEINFLVKVPSNIGYITYFAKVKDKKTINNADLSLVYSEAQRLNLPALFLTTGKLTKKAKEYLDKNLKEQLIFRTLH